MAYQISRCGHSVVLYSDVLYEMQQWFPEVLIRKQAHSAEEFSEYDHILADDHSWFVRKIAGSKSTKRILIPKESEFDRSKQRIFNMQWVLAQFYGINTSDRNNGLRPLGDAVKGRFSKRIAIHPTASDRRRYWGAKKFLELSKRLQKLGYEVGFVMSPEEREEWRREVAVSADLPRFENLSEVARYIYESAYFIGSDSGLGHLASNLGTPTVSIFVRKSHSRNWRPGWSDGVVVSPFIFCRPDTCDRGFGGRW